MNELLKKGFLWGLAATLAMSIVMVIGMATGMARRMVLQRSPSPH